MPKKNKKTNKKIKKEVEKEIKKNFSDTPLLTPIENSEKDIKDLKVQKELNLKGNKKGNRLANIILIILVLLIILVSVDIVCVSKYEKGPYFAIKTHEYKDGGTKEYIGLGYKVIKYNQKQGRRDMAIGLWNMKYYTNPRNVTDLDLAIEFEENPSKALNNYYKSFVRLTSVVKNIDKKDNIMVLEFSDDGKKYTINMECSMAEKNSLKDIKKGDYVRVIGTITGFAEKSKQLPNRVFIKNCFAEKVK